MKVDLERAKGGAEYVDPVEIAAGLFVSARTGEPWTEALEEAALQALCDMRRQDGGFNAHAPLNKNRGFTCFAPSVQTIGIVFEYLRLRTTRYTEPAEAARLARWEDFILRAGDYVVDSAVVGDSTQNELTGWHSDRHPEPERIDVRVTVQAIKALRTLDVLLGRIANMRALSGLDVSFSTGGSIAEMRPPLDCEQGNKALMLHALKLIDWVRYHKEPESALPSGVPEFPGAHACRLLFGPPGAGKTSALKLIGRELQWPVVTITLGDFLAKGFDRVGAMASELFHRLSFVSRCVVVFDEFDAMVPDRKKGDALSSQLTAAMLPLLSSLQEGAANQDCLIAFTTNYAYRMDGAALRSGRVDDRVCLVYPDYVSRLLFWADDWAALGREVSSSVRGLGKRVLGFVERSALQPPSELRPLGKKVRDPAEPPVHPEDYRELMGNELAREEVCRIGRCIGPVKDKRFKYVGFAALIRNRQRREIGRRR